MVAILLHFRHWLMFRRYLSILPLSVVLFSWAYAGEQVRHVVVLESMSVPAVQEHTRYFRAYLNKMANGGNGFTYTFEILNARGDWTRAEKLLAGALAAGRPDLVIGNATLAAKTADQLLHGTGIPLLFMTVSDPVGAGLIEQIGRPGGRNITGKVNMIDRQTRINLVLRLVDGSVPGKPVRIGFIHSTYPSAAGDLRELLTASSSRKDIVFLPYAVPYRKMAEAMPAMLDDVRKGIAQLEDKVDYWWEPAGPLGETEDYTRTLLVHSRKPIVMGIKAKSVEMGALVHLSPNAEATGRGLALLADAVLKGGDPGQMPVTVPDRFDLGLNLTTALKCGIVVPPDILELAGKNVFH